MSNPFIFFMQLLVLGSTATVRETHRTFVLAEPLENFEDCAGQPVYYKQCWECWEVSRAATSTSPDGDINTRHPSSFFSGHVGWPRVGIMSNPFIFFMQVSDDVSSVKCDDPFFVQLTCPCSLSRICSGVREMLLSLLLLCGDVEPNPGPDVQKLLAELLDGQKSIRKRLDGIELKLKKVEEVATAVNEVKTMTYKLEKRVVSLESKLADLEDRNRRNNLIVFGIPETTNESFDELSESVLKGVFTDILEIQVSSAERIHRIGRKQLRKPRPIILKLIDYREKVAVLKNCFKLKGTGFSISEDFSEATRHKRRKLWESTAENRRAGEKVKLIYDKIRVNGVLFVWDADRNERVPLQGNAVKESQQ
ncbi:protein unc-13 homolog C-like isoform X4 [Rhipicephalus sanguineus]|uniref:protein unc-13 homolog C-like isoform X3 n=2 Tax=Rhipicephalus sanguineus TaxID=34632 RepID=UPI0020C38A2C|nr:protein unc-13 homolog C-like isoform X3 [Rhipicephalus sanguineus]XP_049272182.1 protein unc-13 homolog C-like isoform X4 [Rhipicephalus sanguineus]